ncbi:MAG: addiction module protein [Desulfobacterales bacterium]|nr:addiction module protein [Desulfobacterales bacterium]
MGSITAVDTLNLSISERIILVEEIWDTIAAEVDAIEITEEEKNIIDKRLEAYRQNPKAVSSWDAVYKRILVNSSSKCTI